MDAAHAALAKRLGASVRRLRDGLGWSQADLAERIETSVEYVSLIERGERLPALPTFVGLARSLGASLDELAGDEHAARGDDAELVALARSVPRDMRTAVTRMLRGVAEPTRRYGRRER